MKNKGLHIILEQFADKYREWLDKQKQNPRIQALIDGAGIAEAESKNCNVCGDVTNGKKKPLKNHECNEVSSDTLAFKDIYVKISNSDCRNLQDELDSILEDDILYDVDITQAPIKDLSDKEKDRFEELDSTEEKRLKHVCYILNSLIELITNNESTPNAISEGTSYWRKICAKFKVKLKKKEKTNKINKDEEPDKVIGCMDEKAKNYNEKYDTDCGTCCTYDVNLAPISYNISFYKLGQFPDGDKFTMYMDKDTYGVCVQERIYNTLGDDKVFHGYQDDNNIPLNKIEKDRFVFKGDVGFYSDSPSEELKSDLRRAITLYMNRATRSYKGDTEEKYGCVPAPVYMRGIIVEIKDSSGVNHGVIRFGEDNPTLRIDSNGITNWLNYRTSNTPNGVENSPSDIKFYNPKQDYNTFYNITCDIYMKTKWTSKSDYECIENDGGWITIRKVVSESTIGLGTLLEKKEKPPIGLGSLLED
jgi:hypothetical protein